MATTVDQLRNKGTAVAPQSFPSMLKQFLPEIQRALPQHLNGDRMARIALTAFRRTPKLADCHPSSVFAAVIQAAQLGLEPDTMGRSYLIPYGKECQFVPGWKGLVDLVNRSGQATVYTGVIFRDQKYTFRDGSSRELEVLNETSLDDASDITHAYAVGWVKGASMPVIELWRVEKIRKHRDRYNKVGKRHYSYENWEMYCRKVPLLQVLKYMPATAELATAIALSDASDVGSQHLTVDDAINGTWTPVSDDGGGQAGDQQQGQGGNSTPAGGPAPGPEDEEQGGAAPKTLDELKDMVAEGWIAEARAQCPPELKDSLEAIITSRSNNQQSQGGGQQQAPARTTRRAPF